MAQLCIRFEHKQFHENYSRNGVSRVWVIKEINKWGGKKDLDPPTGWNSPYCEEVGETRKVRESSWSGEGYQVLPTALCLFFTGTITECCLLIYRLPWHCLSWQLASHLPPSLPSKNGNNGFEGDETLPVSRLAPPLTSKALHSCHLLTF